MLPARIATASSLVLACFVIVSHALTAPADGKLVSDPTGKVAISSGAFQRTIYLVYLETGVTRKVVSPTSVFGADLSPDGRKLAVAGQAGIWLMNSGGANTRRISDREAGGVAWSPTSQRLLISGAERLYTISTNGTNLAKVAEHAEAADWWPDGKQIVFVRDPEQSSRNGIISAVGIDGRGLHRVVKQGKWYGPKVSPDGSKVAFYKAGSPGVYLAPARGGKAKLFIRNGSQPEWSPDGRYLAFTREVHCGEDVCSSRVFIVSAAGGTAHPYGPVLADMGPFSWSR